MSRFDAKFLPPVQFFAASMAVQYVLVSLVYPEDPISTYELPGRVAAAFSLLNRIPLALPLWAAVLLVVTAIFPFLAFRLFGARVGFDAICQAYADLSAGPQMVSLLAFLAVLVISQARVSSGVELGTESSYFKAIGQLVIPVAGLLLSFICYVPRLRQVTGQTRTRCFLALIASGIVFSVAIDYIFRPFVLQAYSMPSGSMMPTLRPGDLILVNKAVPLLRPLRTRDLIVFKYPLDEERDFVKRVVAVGGETVQVRSNRVYINGQLLDEPYVFPGSVPTTPSSICGYAYGCEPTRVPAGSYFVMGDNRDNSQDSRYWGFVQRQNIRGVVYFRYFPLSSAGPLATAGSK